jgi:two-component system cell cycle sensor histidine kinase/response regulator CckA
MGMETLTGRESVMPPAAVSSDDAQRPAAGLTGAVWRGRDAALWGLALAYAAVAAGLVYALAGAGEAAARLAWPAAGALGLLLVLTFAVMRGAGRAQRLAESRNRLLSESFDAQPQPQLIVDAKGRTIVVNPTFEEMFDCTGHTAMEALHARLGADEASAQELRRLEVKAAAGAFTRAEIEVRSASGESEWFAVDACPIGPRSDVMWRVEDVTAQHQLEQVIRTEHETLFDFLENAPVGFYSVDEEGRFLFINKTLADWLGSSPEAILGGRMRLQDFMVDRGADDAPPYEPFVKTPGKDSGEVTLRGRHGQVVHAVVRQSIVERNGGGLRTRSVVRDLTLEREWERALHESEHRFARFFEDAPLGIALVGPAGRITECNRAFRQLVAPAGDEVIGLSLLHFIAKDDRSGAEDRLKVVGSGTDRRDPIRVRLEGDPERIGSLFMTRVENTAGGTSEVIVHLLDTTEVKNLEMQFAQSQKMQAVGQLAGGIAHDFNNLLTAMIGFCDLLLLRHRPGEQSFADIMQIKQNANRAANLVRQLLAFTRQQTVRPKVLNVTDVLAELSNLLRRLIGEKIEFTVIHGRELDLVRVDQGQLEQLVVNLAVNARDAMPKGGTLTIATSSVTNTEPICHEAEEMPPGEYVLLEVADTGVGIPKKNLSRVFDPFFSTKDVGEGTGLGLATVHGIVKQAEGYLFVDSEVGQGTKFSIFLPRYHGEEEGEGRPAEAGEPVTAGDLTGAGTVLLVEDEDAVRLFSARALRNRGYKVLEAKGGETAIELLKTANEPIDIVITDVVMPDMDGPALIEWIREHHPEMQVVCISGYAEETFRKRLDRFPDIRFLAKPFSLEQLTGTVKEVTRLPAE